MDPIRGHGEADAAERVELAPQLGVERNGGVQQQAPVREADHGHARAHLETEEALRALRDPEVLRQVSQCRLALAHGEHATRRSR